MRISDWSSDVCSSDLFHTELIGSSPRVWLQEQGDAPAAPWAAGHPRGEAGLGRVGYLHSHAAAAASMARAPTSKGGSSTGANRGAWWLGMLRTGPTATALARTEARRVGKECGGTGRT